LDVPAWAWIAAILAGAALALVAIPVWVPTLGASLVGTEPRVSWYLSRATGLVSFVLLWVSMASGLVISNKMARVWPGAFTAFDLHQYTSLLGLGFALFHGLILMANSYINYNLVQVLVPFANPSYRPLWVGIGQVALYLSVLVTVTFYLRKQIGKAWRVIHYLSYGAFVMALFHGLFSGTDSGNVWIARMYWSALVILGALTYYRVRERRQSLAKSRP
jgi:predicted ferric reductase